MITPHCQWGFTDKPDVKRICDELTEAGAVLALISIKHTNGSATLVNYTAKPWPQRAFDSVVKVIDTAFYIYDSYGNTWRCFDGDHVKAFLEVSAVTVKGYKP
jgi:hypothetical protein